MPKSERIRVSLSRDYRNASVQIFRTENDPKPTLSEVTAALRAEGVVHGVDESDLIKALEAASGTRVVVAQATEPKHGCDGIIQLKIQAARGAPKELEDGSVDYKDLGLVRNIRKGQILAVKEPALPGRPGIDVRGRPLPPPEVKDPPLEGGKNTAVTPDGTKLVSLIDGHLRVEREGTKRPLPHVDETFILKKEVGVATGNIDCIGHCLIGGGVADGFKVVANGNITIKGTVEGAEIISRTGEVILERGIRGNGRGKVLAQKRVQARFSENARIECEGEIAVQEHAYHSELLSRGSIVIAGPPGVMLGGRCAFMDRFDATELGSPTEPKTRLYFGDWVSEESSKRIRQIDKELALLEEQAEAMRDTLKHMRTLALEDQERNRDEVERLARSAAPFPRIKSQIETLKTEKSELESKVSSVEASPVAEITGTVHPGVYLSGEDVEEIQVRKEKRNVRIALLRPDKEEPRFRVQPRRG